jgi:hypothetical protein
MWNKVIFLSFTFLFFVIRGAFTQEVIKLQNPSFEDIPRAGSGMTPPITGWFDCGKTNFQSETPPDIHPVETGAWGVSKDAYDGATYLGMVVRDNDSWETL